MSFPFFKLTYLGGTYFYSEMTTHEASVMLIFKMLSSTFSIVLGDH